MKGVENGGGLRRILYDITKAQLLEKAQQLLFPNGKNSSKLEKCEVGLGNFAGKPFTEVLRVDFVRLFDETRTLCIQSKVLLSYNQEELFPNG